MTNEDEQRRGGFYSLLVIVFLLTFWVIVLQVLELYPQPVTITEQYTQCVADNWNATRLQPSLPRLCRE